MIFVVGVIVNRHYGDSIMLASPLIGRVSYWQRYADHEALTFLLHI